MAEQIELPFVLEFGLCSCGRSIHTEGVGAWEIPMRRHLAFLSAVSTSISTKGRKYHFTMKFHVVTGRFRSPGIHSLQPKTKFLRRVCFKLLYYELQYYYHGYLKPLKYAPEQQQVIASVFAE